LLGALVIGVGQAPQIALAQPVAVFDVASVKPTPKGAPRDPNRRRPSDGPSPEQLRSGTFDFGAVLLEYIELAYGAKLHQFSQPLPREVYDQYDITAKAGREVSEAEARAMFRSLLEQRFKLKLQVENKPMPVYVLTVGKNGPKMATAVNDGSQGVVGVSQDGIKWHNISMDYFAAWLSDLHNMDRTVLNRTGLIGTYDFTLARFENLVDKGAASEGRPQPESDPTSVFSAVTDLGLKLQSDNAPVAKYTVEHVEKPDAN